LSTFFPVDKKLRNQLELPPFEQNLEFEIYDSLVIESTSKNLNLMDISPDGQTFSLMDQNTQNSKPFGNRDFREYFSYHYKKKGRTDQTLYWEADGKCQFLNDSEYIPSQLFAGFFPFQN